MLFRDTNCHSGARNWPDPPALDNVLDGLVVPWPGRNSTSRRSVWFVHAPSTDTAAELAAADSSVHPIIVAA